MQTVSADPRKLWSWVTLHSWEKGSRPLHPTPQDAGPLGEW